MNAPLSSRARHYAVAHWSGAIAGRTDLLAGDGVHPSPAAAEVYASTVADTVDRLNVTHAAHLVRAAGHERARELGRLLPAE
ncbi:MULTISPECIES: hypothetical protein [unclassified Microbacterium]|uniref:hypothetical protein n=1 Tax=unclassified Microbacterium TaxID=2609290 RepID=UPI00214D1033|nr:MULTISPECIES: hypothetical protein [unclassified Microbacterium]MCR2784940.1 hypothetical protein [Microbacterium sp. zg.B96]WIM16479.1 hypothetical protein QNO11_02245 [Microbacterium sp. zg-B96]